MPIEAPASVLAVDDNPLTRADIRLVLEDAGFVVCADARDGIEAVELADRHAPDAIVLDLKLPRLDGVAAIRRILEHHDVPIVALTGYSRGGLVDRAVEAGAAGYVLKPFSAGRLVGTLRHVLRTHRREREMLRETQASRAAAEGVRRALLLPPEWEDAFARRLLAWGSWGAVE